MKTRTKIACLFYCATILVAWTDMNGQDGKIVSPSDRILSPPEVGSGEVIQGISPITPIADSPILNGLGGRTLDLPEAPKTSEPLEQLLDRITDQPVTPPTKVVEPDLSGAQIREAVKQQYDAQFNAGVADDGWEDVSKEGWSHQVGGRLVMDYVNWMDNGGIPGASDYFEFRQARLSTQGTGYGVYHYRIELDFEPEYEDTTTAGVVSRFGSVDMKDMFVGIEDVPLFGRVRLGHQKVDFSFAQMMERQNMIFAERPIMSEPGATTPGREVGLSAFNVSRDLNMTLGYGIFFDNISESTKERFDDNQGILLGGRHTFLPFYDEPSNGRYLIHVGSGYVMRNPNTHTARFRSPVTHEGPNYIDSGIMMANQYQSYSAEFAAQAGPASIMSEMIYTTVEEFSGGRRQPWSYYVQASYRLTGEQRNYDRKSGIFRDVVPFENFWSVPGSRGLGAWEVAARYSYNDYVDTPNSAKLSSWDFALNWYLTPSVRFQANYIYPTTKGGTLGTTQSDILLLRSAIYF